MPSRGYFTVTELSKRWAVERWTIYRYIKDGRLYAEKRNGMMTIPIDEVSTHEDAGTFRTVTKKDPLAARAFQLFREGRSMVDVVLALRVDPAVVDALYAQYKNDDLEDRQLNVLMHQGTVIEPRRRRWNRSRIAK